MMGRVGDREGGFTVVELTITMAISMVVMASIFGILDSQTRAERRVSAFADNQEELRQAVIAMQRDIRSSEPLRELTSTAAYALQIDLNVYEDILSATPSPIRWRVDVATKQLVRESLDSSNPPNVTGVTHRVRGVANHFGNPLFSFYKANGTKYELGLDPAQSDTPADIASCTVRIRTRLVAAPTKGPAPAILVSDAQLRNRLPGGIGCPQLQLVEPTSDI